MAIYLSDAEIKFKEKTGYNFNKFYKEYHGKLLWNLQKITTDKDEAREVADDTFIKAMDEIDKYHHIYTIKCNHIFISTANKDEDGKLECLIEAESLFDQLKSGKYTYNTLIGSVTINQCDPNNDDSVSIITSDTLAVCNIGHWIKRSNPAYGTGFDDYIFTEHIDNIKYGLHDAIIETDAGYHIFDIVDYKTAEFSTWLFIIGRRLMFQRLKENKKFESIDEDHDGSQVSDFLISEESNSEIGEILGQIKGELAMSKIMELKQTYSKVLTMRHVEGLTYQEIARYFDTKVSNPAYAKLENKEIRFNYRGIDTHMFTKHSEDDDTEILGSVYKVDGDAVHMIFDSDRRNVSDAELNHYMQCGGVEYYQTFKTTKKGVKTLNVYVFDINKMQNLHIAYNLSTVKSQILQGRKLLKGKIQGHCNEIDKLNSFSWS